MIWKGFIVLTVLINIANSAHFDYPADVSVVEVPFEIIADQERIILELPQSPTEETEEIIPDEETRYTPEDLDYYPDPNTDPEMYRDYYDDYFDTYYYDEEPRDSADI